MATTEPGTRISDAGDAFEQIAHVEGEAPAGLSPWKLARRRLRRNKVALAFGVLFLLLIVCALLAPLWANQVADTGPNRPHLSDQLTIDGEQVYVVELDGVPIGPQYFKADGKFFLGADTQGRDVMVRLLYGARNSLFIGLTASLITVLLGVTLGMLAGYYRKWVDAIISRGMDILWAFPVLLLGIALGVSLALGGFKIPLIGLQVEGNSLWIPTLIIGFVSIVYLARPIRGQVLSLREKEFVEAARAQGASDFRIMFGELLPNVASTILVFVPILMANAILLEAALSFLGAGVRPPNPSWGTMIADGLKLLTTSPHLTVVPGAMLLLTVLSINVFGDGVRDALDPRATIKLER
ncbi:MAG TPA: ABC transporter permease [Solirubrobacteraceae bacterium]|nr:ABC transporter permease [Solirubrobacteraceae bacterium]